MKQTRSTQHSRFHSYTKHRQKRQSEASQLENEMSMDKWFSDTLGVANATTGEEMDTTLMLAGKGKSAKKAGSKQKPKPQGLLALMAPDKDKDKDKANDEDEGKDKDNELEKRLVKV